MKPIVIDSKFVKRELLILLGCFVAAVIFDLVGIILYKRPLLSRGLRRAEGSCPCPRESTFLQKACGQQAVFLWELRTP